MGATIRQRFAQILIGLVTFFNLQSAIALIAAPQLYAPGFELEGIPGQGMVRGIGILFVMWNIPYLVALINPLRHRTSLYEAVAMQAIGLIGETLLLQTVPPAHLAIYSTVNRFILFDASGLAALLLSVWLTSKLVPLAKKSSPQTLQE